MKRVLVLVALAVSLSLGAVAVHAASPSEPSVGCRNIEGGAGFTWDATTLMFSGSYSIVAPACKNITYSLVILDNADSTTPLATLTGTPVGDNTVIQFSTTLADTADHNVCVYGTTSSNGNRVFDVGAPTGQTCLVVDQSPSGGSTSFH
jgi:hypothetical protein